MSLGRISESGRREDKNREERKRNPRKETERNAISGNEEERTSEGSSQTWHTFLQLRRSVPWLIFLSIFVSRGFKQRKENARQDNQNEENLENFLS